MPTTHTSIVVHIHLFEAGSVLHSYVVNVMVIHSLVCMRRVRTFNFWTGPDRNALRDNTREI